MDKLEFQAQNRYYFIDLLKGIGIFQFIIWHVIVNFYIGSIESSFLYRSVFSVTGYFIFSSGFLIGLHYYSEQHMGLREHCAQFNKILKRAIKLILIVIFAGIIINFLEQNNLLIAVRNSVINTVSLLYRDRWNVPLQVLVVISTTLMIGFIFLNWINKSTIKVIFLLLLFFFFYDIFFLNSRLPYLWRYLFQGILGIFVGAFFQSNKILEKNKAIILLAAFSLSIFFIIQLNVIFSLKMHSIFLFKISAQSLSVTSFFVGFSIIFYIMVDKKKYMADSFIINLISNLGTHSLFVYLLQISIINVILLLTSIKLTDQLQCFLASLLLTIFCYVCCLILKLLLKFNKINMLYSIVFR